LRLRAAANDTRAAGNGRRHRLWPQGRGVFLLRPLLDPAAGAEIREWLAARGESWIDDPANEEAPLSIRAPRGAPRHCRRPARRPSGGAETVNRAATWRSPRTPTSAGGGFWIGRDGLRRAGPGRGQPLPGLRLFSAAAGTDRPPARAAARAAPRRRPPWPGADSFTATLAGRRGSPRTIARVHVGRREGRRGGARRISPAAASRLVRPASGTARFEDHRRPGDGGWRRPPLRCGPSFRGERSAGVWPRWRPAVSRTRCRSMSPRRAQGLADATLLTYERLPGGPAGAIEREPA